MATVIKAGAWSKRLATRSIVLRPMFARVHDKYSSKILRISPSWVEFPKTITWEEYCRDVERQMAQSAAAGCIIGNIVGFAVGGPIGAAKGTLSGLFLGAGVRYAGSLNRRGLTYTVEFCAETLRGVGRVYDRVTAYSEPKP